MIAARDAAPRTSAEAVRAAADAIRSGENTVLMLGGAARAALEAAGRIARATGVRLISETSNRRIERGRTRTPVDRLPYPIDLAVAKLKDARRLVLAGARAPVGFFAYPGKPSLLAPPDCAQVVLATQEQDLAQALEWLADELGIAADAPRRPRRFRPTRCPPAASSPAPPSISWSRIPCPSRPSCAMNPSPRDVNFRCSVSSAPHDWLMLTGGAIGIGLPLATGAAVACPDRKVVTLQADGSGMYTLQALWTQARENLDCLTIILANRSYATLHGEMKNVGVQEPGRNARRMLDLQEPSLEWVAGAWHGRGRGQRGYHRGFCRCPARGTEAAWTVLDRSANLRRSIQIKKGESAS